MNYKKSKTKTIYSTLSKLLLISVSLAVAVGILLYSNNVRLTKGLAEIEEEIDTIGEEISNNKNELYVMTDFQNLESAVTALGLIKEASPDYLDLTKANQLSVGL